MFIQDPAAQAGALPKPDPPVFRKRASSVWSQSHVASPTPATDAGSLRSRARSVREVLVGTPVKEGHVNYMLMYDMLTGIRVSVSRCNARQVRELEDADFEAAHKLAFDITGNELTPSSRYDFKFKDYAPFVFRKIRESFRVDTEEYLTSLTGKYMLSELGSPGKSKCFFYFSQDYRFIIKTIHHSEHRFVREVLKEYYEHIRNNPQTLLSRIFGLHRVKLPGNRKIHFVVMGNVMPSNYDVHETYDLKGSTVGRKVPRAQVEKNPRATLKDLNWLENGRKLYLGPEKRELFVGQMEKDVEFLKSMKIMDYSLLVGYHDVTKGNKDRIRDATLSVFQPTPGTLTRHHGVTPAAIAKRISRASTMRRFLGETEIVPFGPSAARLPGSSPAERRCCIFYQTMGGFRATDDANAPLDEVYYLGIIDIFTRYDRNKKVEHFFKSLTNNKTQISAVDPVLYGNRFVSFMTAAIGTQPRSAPAVTAAAAPETVPPSDAVPAVL
ncbi:hypothetical protein DFJ73DRAFT_621018 [Zopfochytrium polystomum]|nr:hypothetical protein DFJ73DRAFT_621018 [Zopfochytrium polystomum]